MIHKTRGFQYGALVAVFWTYVALQVFGNFPHLRLFRDVSVVISAIGFATLILLHFGSRRKISFFSLYIFMLAAWLLLQPAFAAASVWGQPIMYGILARRADILVLSVAILVELSRRGRLGVQTVISGLLALGWVATLVFSATNTLFDPANFLEDTIFAKGGAIEEPQFHFYTHILVFSMFYYWTAARLRSGIVNKLLFVLLIVALLWFGIGRARLLAIVIGILVLEYQIGRISGLAIFLSTTILTGLVALLSFETIAPDQLQAFIEPFQNALNVVLFGIETGEASADARIFQTALAWPIISDHWLLGAGFLSAQWNDGFNGQFDYFYPTDIGLIGALFVYGVVGMGFFLVTPYFAWNYARCASCRKSALKIPYIASIAWLAYAFTLSVSTGYFIFQPATTLFFIYLVGEIRRTTLESAENRNEPYA